MGLLSRPSSAACTAAHFSAAAFRLARPASKSLPTMLSMLMKTVMTLVRKRLGPCMAQTILVASPLRSIVKSAVLCASKGFRNFTVRAPELRRDLKFHLCLTGEPAQQHHCNDADQNQQHRYCCRDLERAVFDETVDRDRQGLGSRHVKQDRHAEFAQGHGEYHHPGGQNPGFEQWRRNVDDASPPGGP